MSANARNANSAGKKKGGGFLARQAKAKSKEKSGTVSEEELLKKDIVTAEDVLNLDKVTDSKYAHTFTPCPETSYLICVRFSSLVFVSLTHILFLLGTKATILFLRHSLLYLLPVCTRRQIPHTTLNNWSRLARN